MKKLLFIAMMATATITNAQKIKKIKYTVDTIHFEELSAPMRRSADAEIMKYYMTGSTDYRVASSIDKYQTSLQNIRHYINGEDKIGHLQFLEEKVQNIKKALPDFDVQAYEQEIAFYREYNKRIDDRQAAKLRYNDSIAKTQKAAYEYRLSEDKHIRDSIAQVEDSMQVMENEASYNDWVKKCVKKYGKKNGQLVADGYVTMGMTKAMVIDAWGETTHKIININGETWTYDLLRWVKLKNGIVIEVSGFN